VQQYANQALRVPKTSREIQQQGSRLPEFETVEIVIYVLWRTINLGRQISDISKKSMQATIYCHYD
jgi:hypothetical protein